MARQIDYYFSLQSPWAYIGHAAFQELAKSQSLIVKYKPVVLGELFAETGGLPLPKRHPVRQHYRLMELQRWREKRGLPFHLRPQHWPFSPKLADGVVIAAGAAGKNPAAFMSGAYKGIWEQQLDLADEATVQRLAEATALGVEIVTRAKSDEVAAQYEQNRQDAIAAGAFGSPAWVLDGEVFWGQDRIELLGDALKSGRKPYTSDV
jgi:2-hydroxychromene-2-carboxylate isomerase